MVKQVVLLAGGKGTRMREMTESLPKPMVEIGGIPVLQHLMNIFNSFGDFEYVVSSGYKSEIIEKYFKDYSNVKVVNTGEETMTGGRVFRLSDYLDDEFIVTYGDGLANVNINNLIKFHNNHETLGTITVANPVSRFGLVEFDKNNQVFDGGLLNTDWLSFRINAHWHQGLPWASKDFISPDIVTPEQFSLLLQELEL